MTQARKTQIDPAATPFYHCINRCVRRAFLCGEDVVTGRSFDHRKQWVVDKLKSLGEVFAIDVCAYAVMSNHYHLVLHINEQAAAGWSHQQVAERWRCLFNGNMLVERWRLGQLQSEAEHLAVVEVLETWRERLMDISWFMRCLNESIARMANEEDDCKGRFWEGRFKSQALLDDAALLTCMMYVDLNPVRAGIVDNLQDSDFTSIQQRLYEFAERKSGRPKKITDNESPKLMGFAKTRHNNPDVTTPENDLAIIRFAFDDYCELIDWTGRAIREDKTGYIPPHIQPLLQQLGIKSDHWLDTVTHFESRFPRMMGCLTRMQKVVNNQLQQQRWCRGFGSARLVYD